MVREKLGRDGKGVSKGIEARCCISFFKMKN